MAHRIKSVKTLNNFVILVVFQNGIEKTYNVRSLYSAFPQFKNIEKVSGLFEQVKVDTGGYGISWNDELDLDSEDIWNDGIETGNRQVMDIVDVLAVNIMKARESAGLSQKQLSELTGIEQSDISKIERGFANPSLSTLERIAEGMGLKLKIEFVKKY